MPQKIPEIPIFGCVDGVLGDEAGQGGFRPPPKEKIVENNNKKIPAPETGAGGVLGSDD
ncbi:hypothetical protein [Flavonifractor sp. An82]|uniref:hypothetical protein n=1 Tax=Flavonifractor sp. An82 TaxID=1965660 RepID=UPI0013A6275F|nr:hypothetical protein [Flavonifractor sp. An82]